MNALLFPGQGSQEVGMGKEIYEKLDKAEFVLDKACEVLDTSFARLGLKIKDLMFNGPEAELKNTRYAQLAIYITSAMYLQKINADGIDYSYVAGHSLGEYSALMAAGVFDFETGLRLVNKRALLMSRMNGRGTMAAVLGLTEQDLIQLMTDLKIRDPAPEGGGAVIANLNSGTQIVISGTKEALSKVENKVLSSFDNDAVKFKWLSVSAAFHSPQMMEIAEELKTDIENTVFKEPVCYVIPNVTGRPTRDVSEIKRCLISQITGQVRWYDTILSLKSAGVSMLYEVGYGDTLKKINKTITFRPKCVGVNLD